MTREFVAEMERRFGTDEAVGLGFRLVDGRIIPAAEYDRLCEGVAWDDPRHPGGESVLSNGGSGTRCTDYATLIYQQLPGRVEIWGFANQNNPTSRVAREQIHPGGHDFALVDGRYIVDPWLRLVPRVVQQMVFDLQDPADAALVADIYGPRECWSHGVRAEAWAREHDPQLTV